MKLFDSRVKALARPSIYPLLGPQKPRIWGNPIQLFEGARRVLVGFKGLGFQRHFVSTVGDPGSGV